MRKLLTPIFLLVFIVGCSTTLPQKAFEITEIYNIALAGAIELRQSGQMSDAIYRDVDIVVQSTSIIISNMNQAALLGNSADYLKYAQLVLDSASSIALANRAAKGN